MGLLILLFAKRNDKTEEGMFLRLGKGGLRNRDRIFRIN